MQTPHQQDLLGKTILLQVVPYFGYDQIIANGLRQRGAEVDVLVDRPFQSAFMHGVAKVARPLIIPYATSIYHADLKKFDRSSYDYVIVINGQTMSMKMLKFLRSSYSNAKFIYYIWDSFENKPYAVKHLKYYDKCMSFDPISCKSYGLTFRPLFFGPEFEIESKKEDIYDISFIGTAHSDRPAVLHRIDQNLGRDIRKFWYLYVKADWVLKYQKITNPGFKGPDDSLFSSKSIPRDRLRDIFLTSSTIVDIEHDKQSGLTIRSFEVIGSRRKLITTNHDVKNYDFYHPDNIFVIDRNNPKINPSFFRSTSYTLDKALRYKYSINGWIDDIIS